MIDELKTISSENIILLMEENWSEGKEGNNALLIMYLDITE